jgi:hypothetical protein
MVDVGVSGELTMLELGSVIVREITELAEALALSEVALMVLVWVSCAWQPTASKIQLARRKWVIVLNSPLTKTKACISL